MLEEYHGVRNIQVGRAPFAYRLEKADYDHFFSLSKSFFLSYAIIHYDKDGNMESQ